MSPPPKNQAEIDGRNRYQAYLNGWTCGAKASTPDERIAVHTDDGIKRAYAAGLADGISARGSALGRAAVTYRVDLSPLRGEV